MAVENITLNLIPTGETPSIHVAQFDVERPFTVTLKEGTDDFTPTGYDIELQVRKVDNNIVTAIPTSTSGNVVTFNTTEQMTACSGTNLAELQLTKDSQTFATLHFYLVVQRDVLAGGVTSESDIYNLTEQITAIVPEVIGDDYYDKMEVDALIAEHTFDPTNYYDKQETDQVIQDAISEVPIFDPTNYYDKAATNALLADKADTADLATVATTGDYDDLLNKPTLPDMTNYYDKSETDALLDDKADVSELPDMSNYYNKTEVDNKITDLYQIKSVSGSLVHITDGGNDIPVKSLVSEIVAVESGSGEKSPTNPYTISGFDSGIITVTDNDQVTNTYTIPFGQTVYGGKLNVTTGELTITMSQLIDLGDFNWTNEGNGQARVAEIQYSYLFKGNVICDSYQGISSTTLTDNTIAVTNSQIYPIIRVKDTVNIPDSASASDIKTFMTGKKACFELATPTSLAISSQDIPTLSGENNISSNTGDIEVEYFTEKSDGIAELIKAFM